MGKAIKTIMTLAVATAVICVIAFFFLPNHTRSGRLPDRYLFPVPQLTSEHDEDGDGETEDVPSRAVNEKHGAGEGGSKILRPFDHIGRKS